MIDNKSHMANKPNRPYKTYKANTPNRPHKPYWLHFSFIIYYLLFIISSFELSSCFQDEDFEDRREGNMEALWTIIVEH